METKLQNIALDRIAPDPGQPRKTANMTQELMDYLTGLGKSIAAEGLNNPIKVRPNPDPEIDVDWMLINGECRWRASAMVGLKEIPAFIDDSGKSAGDIFLDQVLDNETRKNLPPMDTVESYKKALDLGIDIERLAAAVGKSVATISMDLPLLNLPEKAKQMVNAGALPKAVARKIAEFPNSVKMEKALEWALKANNAKDQLAKVEAYRLESSQLRLFDMPEGKDKDALKEAGKMFDRLAKQVGDFANSKYANGKGPLVILARKRELSMVEALAAQMVKIGQKISEDARMYRAQDKHAAM
ncbi:MAG: ParB/RepB/Spo0J family partition protein [Desulfobacterales bacterium]|jgi:ParB family chromosome partitioning protein|nr:ParB/RepB/Spo0J family partition protein [Desulfobacterales bacterium]